MTGLSDARARWLASHILPHEPRVRRCLARAGLSKADLDDVVQEAYARLIRLETVDHVHRPAAYFLQTARTVYLQILRQSRVVSLEAVADLDAIGKSSEEPGPDRHVEGRQELRIVTSAIGRLPKRCREVLLLKKVDGLSQNEIATRLGVTESNVEKLLGRGVKKLLEILERGHDGRARNAEELAAGTADHAASAKQ